MSACERSGMEERAIEEARRGALSVEVAGHLEVCARCEVALERWRRIQRVWGMVAEKAPRRLRPRVEESTLRRAQRHAVAVVVALAVALVGVASFASARGTMMARFASLVGLRRPLPAERGPETSSGESGTRPFVASSGARPPAAVDSAFREPAAVVTPGRQGSPLPTEPPPIHRVPVRAAPPLPLVSAAPSASAASAWIAAAAAMREGDFDAAERAFDALSRTSDLRTREDARLARAQIWLARRDEARARPELEDLASSGSTPVVRRRAADALRSLESSSKSP
jgi:hypothetical protein